MSDSLRPHELQHARPPLSITNSWSSLRFTSIESVMPSIHLILCRPLLLLPPIPPSIKVFSNESTLHMRLAGKESTCNVGDLGSIPGLGRSPGEGNGNPLQYCCLEILRTEETGELQSTGSQSIKHDLATKQQQPMLGRSCLKSCMLGIMQTKNSQMSKLG